MLLPGRHTQPIDLDRAEAGGHEIVKEGGRRAVSVFAGRITLFLRIPARAACAIQLNYTYVKWWNYPYGGRDVLRGTAISR